MRVVHCVQSGNNVLFYSSLTSLSLSSSSPFSVSLSPVFPSPPFSSQSKNRDLNKLIQDIKTDFQGAATNRLNEGLRLKAEAEEEMKVMSQKVSVYSGV